MFRNIFRHAVVRCGPLLILCSVSSATPPKPRPNVLFIASDDLRMNVGCFGDSVAKTPNIDRLAKRSMLFDRAYCQQALCNPSRASLLTGLRPDTVQVWNLTTHFREILPGVVTLPQYFMKHGYFTQDVGKIFHNWRTEIHGDPDSWSVPAVMHFATHSSDVPQIDGGTLPPDWTTVRQATALDVPDEAYFDGRIATLAVQALKDINRRDQPFFLAVGFWKPHAPFNPPKRYWDMYRREDIPTLRNPAPPHGVPSIALHDSGEGLAKDGSTPERIQELRHGYYAATTFMDAQLGRVIDELDRLGLADNTIIVFWSDHGFHLGEHGLWGKTSNFELDAHVPLLISVPGMKQAGKRTDSLVELVDLYPTLVDLCGLPSKSGLEGSSLRAILDNPAATVSEYAFTQHPRPAHMEVPGEAMGYSVCDKRYRYTEWREWSTGKVLAAELYDHDRDPDEMVNIVVEWTVQSVVRMLSRQLIRQFPRGPLPSQILRSSHAVSQ